MARIDRPRIRLTAAALLALGLLLTGADARGFGAFQGPGAVPRTGAWGRPLDPVRPGFAPSGAVRPGFAVRYPRYHRPWNRDYWGYGYGFGGLGLGLGLGGWFGDYGYPRPYDDMVYAPPIYVPPAEVTVETEVDPDDAVVVAACARRFKTYDPATRTYIGEGYVRRHCP